MIINLRGTGGSGKSTVVTRVMGRYKESIHDMVEGRKRPRGYQLSDHHRALHLYVPGHYETACGGCDTLKTVNQVYELVNAAVTGGQDVLYEGIMVADDVTRAAALSKRVGKEQFRVILLMTPVEDCLMAIRMRRAKRGDERPLATKNTVDRARRHRQICTRLEREGVLVEYHDREAAYLRCCELLGVG